MNWPTQKASIPASRNYASKVLRNATTSTLLQTSRNWRNTLQSIVPRNIITPTLLQTFRMLQSSNSDYKTKIIICFLMLGNDFLYSTNILLTPSATRIIMMGSPNNSPSFGHKRKFTIHITIHLSLFTRHYSRVLFTITVHSIILPI